MFLISINDKLGSSTCQIKVFKFGAVFKNTERYDRVVLGKLQKLSAIQ